MMKTMRSVSTIFAALSVAAVASVPAIGEQQPPVPIPQPGVPQIMTLVRPRRLQQ
jgi:hypothetical protein